MAQVALGKEVLYDPLPEDVKKKGRLARTLWLLVVDWM